MDRPKQFIPAQPGWLALFEEGADGEVEIHAETVIAWCLEADEASTGQHVVSSGSAVIGAGPWIDKADSEKTARFFALVREEQLDREFVEELATKAHHSREELMKRALKNHEERKQGHASWVHERRSHRADRNRIPPARIF